MKRAIALGAGGARGAYEIGAWKALRELNIDFDIVVGSSIGSVNGVAMVQEDYDLAVDLWNNISIDKVIADDVDLNFEPAELGGSIFKIMGLLVKILTNKGLDISPFIKMLNEIVNEEKVRASAKEFGIVTLRIPLFKGMEITREEMKDGQIAQYILASSSAFPVFPICKVDGKSYIDGGYYDSLPIDFARKLGAEEVIAVDISLKTTHEDELNSKDVVYIKSAWNLGSFLNFQQDSIQRNIALGYNDTMKAYKKYKGFRYTFVLTDEDFYNEVAATFKEKINKIDGEMNNPQYAKVRSALSSKNLMEVIKEYTDNKELSNYEYLLRAEEICAEIFEKNPGEIYEFENLKDEFVAYYNSSAAINYEKIYNNIVNTSNIVELYNYVKTISSKALVGMLLKKLLGGQDINEILAMLGIVVPEIVIATIYLLEISTL